MKAALSLLLPLLLATPATASTIPLWIGSSATGPDAGVYHADFNTDTGTLSQPVPAAAMQGTGFLAIAPDGAHLFATTANAGPVAAGAKPAPGVAVWKIDSAKALTLVNSSPSGNGLCHISVAPDGHTVMGADYGKGTVVSFRFAPDAGISPVVSTIQHEGKGPHARQEAPHAHAVVPLPGGPFAAAPDLGIDKVMLYRIDPATSALSPAGHVSTPPGSGPRHLAAHPNGKLLYAANELDQSVSVFDWDAGNGKATPKQTVSARPPGLPADNLTSAEIRVRNDGKFLYTSTRDIADKGGDFITVFAIDDAGLLAPVQHQPAIVAIPRNFALTPDGKWLVAGGQKSHNIQVFSIDPRGGRLTVAGTPVACPAPTCFVFHGPHP